MACPVTVPVYVHEMDVYSEIALVANADPENVPVVGTSPENVLVIDADPENSPVVGIYLENVLVMDIYLETAPVVDTYLENLLVMDVDLGNVPVVGTYLENALVMAVCPHGQHSDMAISREKKTYHVMEIGRETGAFAQIHAERANAGLAVAASVFFQRSVRFANLPDLVATQCNAAVVVAVVAAQRHHQEPAVSLAQVRMLHTC